LVIAAATSGTTARVKHLEVDVPGRALVSLEGDHCDCTIKNLSLAETRGGEVRLELDANVGSPPNAFKLHAVIRTFLRDIVKPEN